MSYSVPINDRGLLLADGLFETILVKQGEPILWQAHVDRLAAGCVTLGLPTPDPAVLLEAAFKALHEADLGQARAALRLTWTAGSGGRGLDRPDPLQPRLIAQVALAPVASGPARLALAAIRRNESSPTSRLKTLAYLDNILARREARAEGADEALMLNTQDDIAGCAAANIFWIERDRLLTPALECGALDGIVRGEVLKVAAGVGLTPEEVCTSLEALAEAKTAFITSSLVGVRPVTWLDGRTLESDERVAALQARLAEVS